MASSLSDKATFIYDTFFSADITSGKLDSQIKESSLFRLSFEEVISYPNLLDKMKSHDRYDELIGINTEAYSLIQKNATREENSQLEANAFLFITNTENDSVAFTEFLSTVSGHIGYGLIIDNPKTAFDIANNSHAVDLILGNSDATTALLNSENGLNAFGKNPTSSLKIYQQEEVFKKLRASLRFNQEGVAPGSFSTDPNHYFKKHGSKYIYIQNHTNYIYISDDMHTWTKVTIPNDSTGNSFVTRGLQAHGDAVGYDHLNQAWFFASERNGAKIKWTKDFTIWYDLVHTVGNSYIRTLSSWDDKIWFYDYIASNAWQLSYIQMEAGANTYAPRTVPNPNQISVYGKAPEDPDFPYMIWHDVNYNFKFMNKSGEFPYRVTDQNGWFYAHDGGNSRTARGISYANGYFFFTYGTSGQMGISRIDLRHNNDAAWTYDSNNLDTLGAKISYWYNFETNDEFHVSYANGVYIVPITGGYATSTNGVVWDEQLYDVTYQFNVKGADERGFYGNVPGTNFVLTSYDASTSTNIITTTTSTTTSAPVNLPLGLSELECLIDSTEASVLEYNGIKMVFNNKDYYENTNYVVTNGDYKILNVPENYPIAVLNKGKEQKITYTGNKAKRHFIKTSGTDADASYDFFYGDVTIKVRDNFENISLYYYKKPTSQGYIGMEKILVHQDYLTAQGHVTSDTTSKVSDTTIYASSIRNFDCVGNEALEDSDIVRVEAATTSTTTSTPRNQKLFLYQDVIIPTTTAFPYTITDLPTEVAITFDGSGNVLFNGAAYAANTRYGLEEGTYIFTAPDDDPIAIAGATSTGLFGSQESQISYSGDFYKRSVKSVDGVPHYFYHGEMIVIVDGDFGQVSIYRFNENTYAGGQDIFKYSPISHTSTTTLPLTTSTTTLSSTDYTFCVTEQETVTVSNGYYLFDARPYVVNEKIGLTNGTYILRNVPQSHPIAILNYGNWANISYSGEPMKSISHTAPDGHMYNYYYGDVTIQVFGNFGVISYDCSNHGYMGGQDRLVYDDTCPVIAVIPTTSTTLQPTTTTTEIPNSLIETTTTIIPTTLEPTTTSSTTLATSAEYCLSTASSGNTVTFSGGEYVFNGNSGLYGMASGTYVFKNVSASHPIAFLNYGKTNSITYSGQYAGGNKVGADGYSYPYYYGDVTVTVTGDFGFLSYECFYHGYMGGQNNIIYDNTTCN